MTRVLAFCDYLQEPMGGGAEIVSAEVYRRLASADGFDITVMTGVPGPATDAAAAVSVAGPNVDVRESRGLDLSRLVGAQLSVAPMLAVRAWRSIRSERPDVIHASSIHFFGSFVGAVLATVFRVPLVTTCHLSGLEALPKRTRLAAALYERTVGRFILKRSERVIAVSETVRDHVKTLGVDPNRIDVIENGVDADRFAPAVEGNDGVVMTFVGRLIENKGPMEVLAAFEQVAGDHVQLQVVGAGPLEDEVKARAGADRRIHVLGHRTDVDAILATTDIFVRLSTTEGRSLAALEAMAAGCAVVLSDIAANAELVDHERTGILVATHEPPALVAALQRLVDDPDLCARLGRAARAEAELASWDAASFATGVVLRAAAKGR